MVGYWEQQSELTDVRARFIRDAGERFRLHTVSIGVPDLMTLWVDPADVRVVRRLAAPYDDLGFTDIRADQ